MRLLALVIAVVLVASASAASAQVQGPPVPPATTSGDGIGVVTPAGPSRDGADAGFNPTGLAGINPLEVLDGAGRSLPGGAGGLDQGAGSGLSPAINILLVLSVIALAPSLMLMTTCFVRIVIVLGLLRQALGTQSLPPPQVIVGLSLFMTLMVMTPTLDRINSEAVAPYRSGEITDYDELWVRGTQPMRDFMFDQIEATGNWSSLYMVMRYRGIDISEDSLATMTRSDVDLVSLVPAYMLSELKVGFLMGFKVYLPFLVIDIVIASLLISMGMMMLPPVLISLPFKLLLFVLVDGWTLVVGSLLESVSTPGAPDAVRAATGAAMGAGP